MGKKQHDVAGIKIAASGRWIDIFRSMAGVEIDPNIKKHGPCPKCGGVDRFRMLDPKSGALYCNQCFKTNNGDGIAALGWLTGNDFKETIKSLADYLNVAPTKNNHAGKSKPAAAKDPPRTYATPQGLVRAILPGMIKKHGAGVKLVAYWKYTTFTVLRFNLPTPADEKQRKEFRPIHQVPLGTSGAVGWQSGYPDGLRPLYRLENVKEADDDLITIHGGEKAADAAAGIGVAATTNAGGEQAIKKNDWSPVARFKTAAIVVDNDEAGEKFGKMLAWILRQQSPDQVIKIVRLPNLPPKGDVVEWVAAGGTKDSLLQIVGNLPAAEAKKVDLPGEVNEADDDPHRLANIFLDEHCQYPRLVFWRGEYWRWDKYYRNILDIDLRSEVTKSIKAEFDRINIEKQAEAAFKSKDGKKDDGEKPKVKRVHQRLVSDVMGALKSIICLSGSIDQQTWIDGTNKPNCVTVENCLLDLDAFVSSRGDWELPHTHQWFSPIYLPYSVDTTCKNCASPIWDEFMNRALDRDQERIATLQEWMGYCLTHDTSMQRFIMLEGEGGGGKSTFCAALIALLGRQNVAHIPLERFGDKFTLSTTLGKLANISAECGELDKAAEGTLKSFTSGDRMTFEKKNQQPFSAMPTARLILAANNRPRFADRSTGLWRRMIVVPFNAKLDGDGRTIGMDKPEFWERSGELPGIFWWAVLGLNRLRERQEFTISPVSKAALEEYKLETNPARTFLVENCQAVEVSRGSCSEMYTAYSLWCKNKGYHPLGDAQFGKEVFRAYPRSEKKKIGGRGDRFSVYTGIELIESEDQNF